MLSHYRMAVMYGFSNYCHRFAQSGSAKATLAEQEQLSPEELARVSGGFGDRQDSDGHDAWCLTIWNCFTVTLHNLSAKEPENLKVHAFYNSACWSNYRCIALHYGL